MKKLLFTAVFLICLFSCALAEETHAHQWTVQFDREAHWSVCGVCGQVTEREEHYVLCYENNPTACAACGVSAYDGARIEGVMHFFDDGDMGYDRYSHFYTCQACQNEVGRELHWSSCLQPDLCLGCGLAAAEGIEINEVVHLWQQRSDSLAHWEACLLCSAARKREEHYIGCDAQRKDVCTACGAAKADGAVVENTAHFLDDRDVMHDAQEHWYICLHCGETVAREKHAASCSSPDRCLVCRQSVNSGIQIDHLHHEDPQEMQRDGQEHWQMCGRCGYEILREAHYALCTAPGKCAVCGAAWSGEAEHVITGEEEFKPYNEAYHSFVCRGCRQTAYLAHAFENGVCAACGSRQSQEEAKAPVYTLQGLQYDGKALSGTLLHDAATRPAGGLILRVTFYIEGNYYMGTTAEVEQDGSFLVEGVGPIVYITALASGRDGGGEKTLDAAELFVRQ